MSKIVVFCENYTTIKTTLYLATRNGNDCPITIVIPGNHDLFKFFQVINERVFHNAVNLIYLESYKAKRVTTKGIKKVFHVLPDIIKERRYLKEIFNKYFTELKGWEIIFFSRGFSGVKFYLLKKLSKRNRLVYVSHISPNITPIRKYTPTNIADLASLLIGKLIYGLDIAMGKFPHVKGFVYIPDKFMEKNADRVIDWEEKNEMMKGFDLSRFKIFDIGDYDVIYFGHEVSPAWVSPDTLKRELTEVFNILSKYFPEKRIAHKYHPLHNIDKIMVNVGDILPDFIPAEFLYNDNVKIYFTVNSMSIVNVEKGLPVSIMDLISFNSDKIREQIRERLVQVSRSEILFPKSLDEFERILADVKQQTR